MGVGLAVHGGVKAADKWYPVELVDSTDGFTGETGKLVGDLTVEYAYEADVGWTVYGIIAAEWKEVGDGWYWMSIGAGEFAAEGKYIVQVQEAGSRNYAYRVEIGDHGSTKAADVDAVWDEILNAAGHNIPGSAGRRLRQLDPDLFPVWYVDGVGGNDANDGDSPDHPFLTIGAALAVVGVGESIVVGAATYAEAALDLDVASVTLSLSRGAIITGGGGTCLVVSAANCIVINGLYRPPGANIGIDVQATGDDALIMNCRTDTCSVGYDINASRCALVNCRSIDHSVTGFDISGDWGRFEHCESMGSGAVRGFYLSVNTADNNHFHDCHSLGNTTAGWEVVAGADDNCFAFCAMAPSDGAVVDNGTDNGWGGFAEEELLTATAALEAEGAVFGTVNDVGATAEDFDTDLTEASDDHYNNSRIVFLDGNLAEQWKDILDYDGAAKNITVDPVFTEAPGNGDAFVILPCGDDLLEKNGLDEHMGADTVGFNIAVVAQERAGKTTTDKNTGETDISNPGETGDMRTVKTETVGAEVRRTVV